MPRFRPTALALLFLLGAHAASAADAALESAIRNSHFVFAGTFERIGASNLSLLPASDATAIVRVREVIDQPAIFSDLGDARVTVRLADPAGATEGGQAIFFSTGLMWGEHLAVEENLRLVSRTPEAEAAEIEQVQREVARVRALEADEELSARLAQTAVVVLGRIGDVRPRTEGREEDFGEHAAAWAKATIEVETTLKGRAASAVHFAQDTDHYWRNSPKLAPGQEGIFLLQLYEGRDLPAGSYIVLHALDVQPRTELERVRGLLR